MCAALLTALLAGGSAFAATENPDGSETLWSATLTVKTGTSFNGDGYYSRPDPDEDQGALTSTSFTYNGNTHSFTFFGVEHTRGCPEATTLSSFTLFDTVGGNWQNAETRWVLYVGSHALDFADAAHLSGVEATWCDVTTADLGWSDGDMVEVRIVRRNEPGVPTNLTAAASSATQIDLDWDAPAKTGGSDITGYKIEVSTDRGTNWSDLVADTESTETAYQHTGLSTGDTRRYRVSAINAIGTGSASEAIEATTHAVPSAPRHLTLAAGNTKVVLNWTTPANGGSAITKYQVRRKAGSGSFGTWADILESDADTTSHEVTGLTNGTAYTFEVQAVNAVGNGAAASVAGMPDTGSAAWSFTVTATDTDANGDPVLTEGGASITATATITNGVTFTSAQTVALQWGAADLTTGFVVGAGGVTAITVDAGQSSGSLTISAPDTDTTPSYSLPKAHALTATHAGTRIGSLDLTFVDDEDPPTATIAATPTTVTEGGAIEVEVSLNLPFDTAIPVRIAVTDADGALTGTPPTRTSFASGETTRTITLTADDNLTPNDGGRTVTVALRRDASDHYTLGTPSSVTVTVQDNDTPPTGPRNLTATAISATRIDLDWDEPENTGGLPVTGYRIEVSADGGMNWTELVADTASTDTAYSDIGTPPFCTALLYRVSGINDAGTGPASASAAALARYGPPGAPVVPSGHPEIWSAELVAGGTSERDRRCHDLLRWIRLQAGRWAACPSPVSRSMARSLLFPSFILLPGPH